MIHSGLICNIRSSQILGSCPQHLKFSAFLHRANTPNLKANITLYSFSASWIEKLRLLIENLLHHDPLPKVAFIQFLRHLADILLLCTVGINLDVSVVGFSMRTQHSHRSRCHAGDTSPRRVESPPHTLQSASRTSPHYHCYPELAPNILLSHSAC